MPYIDTWSWFETKLVPLKGESYTDFMARCVPAIMQLEPGLTYEVATQYCETGWAHYVLKHATEVTLTMKRDLHQYQDEDSIYVDAWYSDWQVTDIHNAVAPQVDISYSSIMKHKPEGEEKGFRITKSAEDEQLVFGWANIAVDANGEYPLDWDGDITDPKDLEKAAYNFVLKYRATGEQHQGEVKGDLVESIMFTKEKQQALGIPEGTVPEGWWCGFHIPDKEVFAKIKSGEYEMFSVEGTAIRQPTEPSA